MFNEFLLTLKTVSLLGGEKWDISASTECFSCLFFLLKKNFSVDFTLKLDSAYFSSFSPLTFRQFKMFFSTLLFWSCPPLAWNSSGAQRMYLRLLSSGSFWPFSLPSSLVLTRSPPQISHFWLQIGLPIPSSHASGNPFSLPLPLFSCPPDYLSSPPVIRIIPILKG